MNDISEVPHIKEAPNDTPSPGVNIDIKNKDHVIDNQQTVSNTGTGRTEGEATVKNVAGGTTEVENAKQEISKYYSIKDDKMEAAVFENLHKIIQRQRGRALGKNNE